MKPSNLVAKKPKALSPGEEAFAAQLKSAGYVFEREYRPVVCRRWRVDFAIWGQPKADFIGDKNLTIGTVSIDCLVEIEGFHWGKSRHGYGAGFEKDLEKRNAIMAAGYRTYFFTTKQAVSGEALAWLKENRVL